MKSRLLLCLLASVLCLSAHAYFNPKPVSPRRIEIGSKGEIKLAEGGKASFEVVVPAKLHANVDEAGNTLCKFMNKILGSDVKVTRQASGTVPAFIVGDRSAAARLKLDLEHLDQDGYFIVTEGQNIIIIGNDATKRSDNQRGTYFGVLEFLERFGGVRFYFPGDLGTVVPKKTDWTLPRIYLTDRPDNQYRKPYIVELMKRQGKKFFPETPGCEYKDFYAESVKTLRYSTFNIPNCHGLAMLGYRERFAKTHPEVFALKQNGARHDGTLVTRGSDIDGQLCFTCDFLKEQVYLDAKAFLNAKGDSAAERAAAKERGVFWRGYNQYIYRPSNFVYPFFNIMPNDSNARCFCENCKKVYAAGEQAISDHIWKFETDIAKRLKDKGVPGYITVMAYANYRTIPTIDIPDNVIVMLAMTGPWNEGQPQARDKFYGLLKDWTKKMNGCKIYMWNYTTKCGNEIANIPNFTPKAVASFYKNTAPYSFGAFMESETDYWMLGFLNYYMFSKVMWDVNTDPEALLDEHCRLMFGAAARNMRNVYDSLEKHWLNDIMSNIRETNIGPQAVLPSTYEMWNKIYSPAETERIEKLFDDSEKLTAGDADSLARVRFIRKELWGHVLDGRKEYEKANEDREAWTLYFQPTEAKITIDGKLDEAAWKGADYVVMGPRTKKFTEVHTRVRALCDKDNFYIGVECDEPLTDNMLCAPRKFDEVDMWRDNLVELFFAPNAISESMYQIMLPSSGAIADMVQAPGRNCDTSWNSGLEYKPSVVPGKMWIAEVRIPRASMPDIKGDSFCVNFSRGRILDKVTIAEPYYIWCPFKKQKAEYCGRAFIGKKPEDKNLFAYGDMNAPVTGKRFLGPYNKNNPKSRWFSSDVLFKDETCFITKGASLRLEKDQSNPIRHYLPQLKPNTKYRLSFFYRLENVKPSGNRHTGFWVQLRFSCTGNGKTDFVPFRQTPVGDIEWQRFSGEFTTPAVVGDIETPYMHFGLPNILEGRAWIDNVELVEVNE